MNEEISSHSINIQIEDTVDKDEFDRVKELLETNEGIIGIFLSKHGVLRIDYYPYVLSPEMIRKILVSHGITLKRGEEIKNPFKRFIYKLAKSNEKTFGSEPLECCKLNKKTHSTQ